MDSTESQLLTAAKCVFLEKGYDKTTLRALCEQAHMTTGALYGLWPGGKKALFESLIEPAASMFFSLVENGTRLDYNSHLPAQQMLDQAASNGRCIRRQMNDFVWDHREAFTLLLRRANPDVTNAYINKFILLEEKQTTELIDYVISQGYPLHHPDPISLHCFCTAFWHMVFYLLMESSSREHSAELMEEITTFFSGGWHAVNNLTPSQKSE